MATDQQRTWNNGQQRPPAHYRPPKLTSRQRDEIRRRIGEGETFADLATEFQVSTRTIRQNS